MSYSRLLLLFIALVWATKSYTQTANFTLDNASGCAPLIVNFDATSSTGTAPLNYLWDFGNGNTTDGTDKEQPGAIYTQPGNYQVTLIVEDANGNRSAAATRQIQVIGSPVAGFEIIGESRGCVPLQVSFNDSSIEGDGTITSYLWDFGDGTSSTAANPTHEYLSEGVYNVSLIVTDENGCSHTVTQNGIVRTGIPSNVDFTTTGERSSCNPSLPVTFTNTTSFEGTGPFAYLWNFGDGTNSTAINPSKTYDGLGSYDVSLTITDLSTGCAATEIKEDYINLINLEVSIEVNSDGICAPVSSSFTNTSPTITDNMVATWDFGDGNTLTGTATDNNIRSPTHTYRDAGTYSITLTMNFDNGVCIETTELTDAVTVVNSPSPDFTAGNNRACDVPFTVNFSSEGTDIAAWEWDFGDGTTSTEPNPQKTYTAFGNYAVRLTVTNAEGCSATRRRNNYIRIVEPVAEFTSDIFDNAVIPDLWDGRDINLITGGCIPLDITFTDLSVSGGSPIVRWDWDFGDGNTGTGQNPTHTYTVAGEFIVTLTITTEDGCTETFTCYNCAKAGNLPQAQLDTTGYPLLTNCAPATLFRNLTDTSTIDFVWYAVTTGDWEGFSINDSTNGDWDFGTTVPVFLDSGQTVSTKFYTYDRGCVDVFDLNEWAELRPPWASVGLDTSRCESNFVPGEPLEITPLIIGDFTRVRWTISSLSQPPKFDPMVFEDTVGYPIFFEEDVLGMGIMVWNDSTGFSCSTYGEHQLQLKSEPDLTINADVRAGCGPLTVNFSLDPGIDISAYRWDFGDGNTSNEQNPTHTYTQPGLYSVTIAVTTPNNCTFSNTAPDFINVSGNVAQIAASIEEGCTPLSVDFTDLSISTTDIVQRIWDFGDGNELSGNDSLVNHVFQVPPVNQANGFYVKLTIVDTVGCVTIDSLNIRPYQPIATFEMDVFPLCDSDSIVFTASAGDSVGVSPFEYFWDTGNGHFTASNERQFTSIYPTGGPYDVQLTMADAFGCRDTSGVSTFTVTPFGPAAGFTADDSRGTCPPLPVRFTNTSYTGRAPIVQWLWDFGDGTTSDLQNPDKIYTTEGSYDVRLDVLDSLGCSSSLLLEDFITLEGITGSFAISDTLVCVGETITFTAQSPEEATFTWDFGDGNIAIGAEVTHQYTADGIQFPSLVIAEASGVCTATFTSSLTVRPVPAIDLGADRNICFGDSTPIDVGETPFEIFWNTGAVTPSITVDTAGAYIVRLTDPLTGCSGYDTLVVTVNPLPVTSLPEEIRVCQGETVSLILSSPDTLTSFTWYNEDNSLLSTDSLPEVSVDFTQLVTVEVTDQNGCVNSDSIRLIAVPPPLIDLPDAVLCEGTELTVDGTPSNIDDPGATFSWTQMGNDSIISTEPTLTIDEGGVYLLHYTSGTCEAERSFELTPVAPPTIDTDRFTFLCEEQNGEAIIDAGPGFDYFWEFDESRERSLTVNSSGIYHFDVYNEAGCVSSDSIVVADICPPVVLVPTAFSPNDDGINEFFTINVFHLNQYALTIFNRWGEVIYRSSNPNTPWDGQFNGQAVPVGVYAWLIEYNGIHPDHQEMVTREGSVTVVR